MRSHHYTELKMPAFVSSGGARGRSRSSRSRGVPGVATRAEAEEEKKAKRRAQERDMELLIDEQNRKFQAEQLADLNRLQQRLDNTPLPESVLQKNAVDFLQRQSDAVSAVVGDRVAAAQNRHARGLQTPRVQKTKTKTKTKQKFYSAVQPLGGPTGMGDRRQHDIHTGPAGLLKRSEALTVEQQSRRHDSTAADKAADLEAVNFAENAAERHFPLLTGGRDRVYGLNPEIANAAAASATLQDEKRYLKSLRVGRPFAAGGGLDPFEPNGLDLDEEDMTKYGYASMGDETQRLDDPRTVLKQARQLERGQGDGGGDDDYRDYEMGRFKELRRELSNALEDSKPFPLVAGLFVRESTHTYFESAVQLVITTLQDSDSVITMLQDSNPPAAERMSTIKRLLKELMKKLEAQRGFVQDRIRNLPECRKEYDKLMLRYRTWEKIYLLTKGGVIDALLNNREEPGWMRSKSHQTAAVQFGYWRTPDGRAPVDDPTKDYSEREYVEGRWPRKRAGGGPRTHEALITYGGTSSRTRKRSKMGDRVYQDLPGNLYKSESEQILKQRATDRAAHNSLLAGIRLDYHDVPSRSPPLPPVLEDQGAGARAGPAAAAASSAFDTGARVRQVNLSDSWKWKDRIATERNTQFVWGANMNNWNTRPGESLRGGGMAGISGPSGGFGRRNYFGVPTTTVGMLLPDADKVVDMVGQRFESLRRWLQRGGYIELPLNKASEYAAPLYNSAHGTGLGMANARDQMLTADWDKIQVAIVRGVNSLFRTAGASSSSRMPAVSRNATAQSPMSSIRPFKVPSQPRRYVIPQSPPSSRSSAQAFATIKIRAEDAVDKEQRKQLDDLQKRISRARAKRARDELKGARNVRQRRAPGAGPAVAAKPAANEGAAAHTKRQKHLIAAEKQRWWSPPPEPAKPAAPGGAAAGGAAHLPLWDTPLALVQLPGRHAYYVGIYSGERVKITIKKPSGNRKKWNASVRIGVKADGKRDDQTVSIITASALWPNECLSLAKEHVEKNIRYYFNKVASKTGR
jgi:hypothetical protein